jgi:hypothetical protein
MGFDDRNACQKEEISEVYKVLDERSVSEKKGIGVLSGVAEILAQAIIEEIGMSMDRIHLS